MKSEMVKAVRDKAVLSFSYGGHVRTGEPHIVGAKNGVDQILFYQTGGTSSSGDLPEWRRFDLNKISGFARTGEHFAGKRPTPSGRHSDWDTRFVVVED
jgi:hypothetical protein